MFGPPHPPSTRMWASSINTCIQTAVTVIANKLNYLTTVSVTGKGADTMQSLSNVSHVPNTGHKDLMLQRPAESHILKVFFAYKNYSVEMSAAQNEPCVTTSLGPKFPAEHKIAHGRKTLKSTKLRWLVLWQTEERKCVAVTSASHGRRKHLWTSDEIKMEC